MQAFCIDPSDDRDTPLPCDMLRVFVPDCLQGASVRVTPLLAADDHRTVTLSFPPGLSHEPLAVRRVWATGTSSGVELHGYHLPDKRI